MKTNDFKKTVEIIGGGTVSHVRNHLALSAPAYGATARRLAELCNDHSDKLNVSLYLTRMASGGQSTIETNDDVAALVQKWKADPNVKIVFFNAALVDFDGHVANISDGKYSAVGSDHRKGKHYNRLNSRDGELHAVVLSKYPKLIKEIRKDRKDIFLVGFKTTCGVTADEQYLAGLNLLKESSCNLVLANDVVTRTNMIITPEEARYHVTTDREIALKNLVEMAYLRSHLSFTRSTVVAGESIPWNSPLVPDALRSLRMQRKQ